MLCRSEVWRNLLHRADGEYQGWTLRLDMAAVEHCSNGSGATSRDPLVQEVPSGTANCMQRRWRMSCPV